MCLTPAVNMQKLSESVVRKLQCILQRQNLFYSRQNLRELNKDEFDHYMNVRTACVHYIKVPHVAFNTGHDTFATAVNILDVFLWKVKVTERHMSIVAAGCYFIAAKMLEAEQDCPTAQQISYHHEWTSNDLCRIELRILEKLDWCVLTVSYLDFLPLFADVYKISTDLLCSDPITALAEKSLSKKSTVLMQPAVFALALVHHVTEGHHVTGEVLPVLLGSAESQLLVHCNITESDLNQCKKNLSYLSSPNYSSPPSSPTRLKFPMKIFDKPSEMGITCLPTIVEEPSA